MKQKIVAENNGHVFEKLVQELMDEGWRACPESLRVSGSHSNGGYFLVILEKSE